MSLNKGKKKKGQRPRKKDSISLSLYPCPCYIFHLKYPHQYIYRVDARTIADLDGKEKVMSEHLAEAINYRSLDRENWGK